VLCALPAFIIYSNCVAVLYREVILDAIDYMTLARLSKPRPAGPGVGMLVKHGVGHLIGTEETLQTVVSEPLIFCSIMGHTHIVMMVNN